MSLRNREIVTAIASAAVGGGIWAASPLVTGQLEPWDSDSGYYVASLFGSGLVLGLLMPRNLIFHYAGALFGQVAYLIIFVGAGPLFVVGLMFMVVYTGLFLLGALAGSKFRTEFLDIKFRRHGGT